MMIMEDTVTKGSFTTLLVIFALLTCLLPAAVLAGSPQTHEVEVRNLTGATAEVSVIDAEGHTHFFSIPSGLSFITLEEGVMSYYVGSACGNSSGIWNLSKDKTLWIECSANVDAHLTRWEAPKDICRSAGPFNLFSRLFVC